MELVYCSGDNTVRLWDTQTGKAIGKAWQEHSGDVMSVAFSPNGKQVVSGSVDDPNNSWNYTILIWDVDEKSWKERLCRIAGRNFTPSEWQEYLGDRPYEQTCPHPIPCWFLNIFQPSSSFELASLFMFLLAVTC